MKIQPAFSFEWKPLGAVDVSRGGYQAAREWQLSALKDLEDSQHVIINAPTGSGKTRLMCMKSAEWMLKNKKLKTIICVPQDVIAPGFSNAAILMPDGSELDWVPNHDLCHGTKNQTTKYIINWLKRESAFFGDGILVCTHAAFVAVYKSLKETNDRKLLRNLICWIDEAHHVQNVESEDGAVFQNMIGELCSYLLKQSSVHLGLATASPFRGDRTSILTSSMYDKFKTYNMSYEEYFSSMKYLKSFSYDFVLCGNDYTKAIDSLLQDQRNDIIYIPHPSSTHSTGDKYDEVKKIINGFRKVHGGKEVDLKNGLTILRSKSGDFKLLDLVDEDRRKVKKDYFRDIEDRSDLNAVITLNMFKEGGNWVYADRAIVAGVRNSLVDNVQIPGRLFRDVEGKEHVSVVYLLPFTLDKTDEDRFRKDLNNYLKAILASLVVEDIVNPVRLKAPKTKSTNKKLGKKLDFLSDVLPNMEDQISLRDDVCDELINISINISSDPKVLWKEYQKSISSILNQYGITQNIDQISKQLWASFARRTLSVQGLDVSQIDFDLLKKTDPLGFLTCYTSSVCDCKTLGEFRSLISGVKSTEKKEELYELARAGATRPSSRTLLGSALHSYTTKNRNSYDSVFDKKIRALRPDWFEGYGTRETSTKKKEKLYKLARSGATRPNSKTPLGSALVRYVTKSHNSYDPVFDKKIRALRPDWFESSSTKKKEKLYELARTRSDRPAKKTLLGSALSSYTTKSNSCYDSVFDKKIRALRPDWFEGYGTRETSAKKKEKLYKLARSGAARPTRKHSLGRSLSSYTNKSYVCYDSVFDKKIRALRSDWFKHASKSKKLVLS